MVDRALDDAASVTMSGDFDAVGADGIIDELIVFRRQLVKTLLHNVVSVQVLDERDDIKVEGKNEILDLAMGRKKVDHFLNSSGSL
jgi:hypothetical protein